MIAKFIDLSAKQEEVQFIVLRVLQALRGSAFHDLFLLVHLHHLSLLLLNLLLLEHQLLCSFVQLVDVATQILRRSKLEQLVVEDRHVGLDVVEQECLQQVTSVYLDWDLFEELSDSEIGLSDFILDQAEVSEFVLQLVHFEYFNSLLGESEDVDGVETIVRLADVVD